MSNSSRSCPPLKCLVVLALVAVGCGGGESQVESVLVTGADEELGTSGQGITACVTAGVGLRTTSELNLRSGPAATYTILRTMPQNAVPKEAGGGCPTSGWYKLTFDGVTGWASGTYLATLSTSTLVRDQAIVRAQKGVGFSYWWGHGAFNIGSDTGSCSGSCGSCTHTGSYGGDCSGYLAKVWVVPSTNSNLAVDSHPYSTVTFNTDSSQWFTISRGSMLKADAMVYNESGAGHTFVYESGDGWGSMLAYECKGCSYGCTYNSRTASTSYHGIRHF
jgi:hypothetical protein